MTICLFLSQLLSVNDLVAQKLHSLETITVDDGLSFRNVKSIIQDNKGLMWFGTANGLCRYDGYRFINFGLGPNMDKYFPGDNIGENGLLIQNDTILWVIADDNLFALNIQSFKATPLTKIEGKVKTMISGQNNEVWLLSEKQMLNKEENLILWKHTTEAGFQKVNSNPNFRFALSDIEVDSSGNLWWSSMISGLQKYSSDGILLEEMKIDSFNWYGSKMYYTDFIIAKDDQFLIFSRRKNLDHDVVKFDPKTNTKEILIGGLKNIKFSAFKDSGNDTWLMKEGGLLKLQSDLQVVDYSNDVNQALDFSEINIIYEDNQNILWFGTDGGIFKFPVRNKLFKNHFSILNSGWGNSIRGIGEDQNGQLFFMCENGNIGFYQQDKNTKHNKKLDFGLDENDFYSSLGSCNFLLFDERENCVWTVTNKLLKLDLESQEFESPSETSFSLSNSTFNPIVILADGKILYGNTLDSLQVFNPKNNLEVQVPIEKSEVGTTIKTKCFLQKNENQIWVGSEKDGVYLIDLNGSILNHYHTNSQTKLSNNNILHLLKDDSSLWIATQGGGLNKLDLISEQVSVYNNLNGLPENNVASILEDQDQLWIATYNGLTCFNKSNETFQTFYQEDGLTHNEFNYSSFYKSKDGQMYFGGMNGINSFSPNEIGHRKLSPALQVTKFIKHDQKLDSLYSIENINDISNEIIIKPSISFFQFEWTLPKYLNPAKSEYYSWLEGLEKDWNSIGNTPYIRFNKLPAGKYTWHLKGKDSQGNWSNKPIELKIVVIPPWYKEWWAYCSYLLLTIGTFLFFWKRESRRLHLQNQLKIEHLKAERLLELDKSKARFFANISHEFRTPLTVISGMVDQMESNPKEWFEDGVQMIKRNSDRLLDLVNKMLDLSKLESGKMPINQLESNILAHLKYLVESIHSLAQSKNIKIHFLSEEDQVMMAFDPDKIQQVLTNLLSNAIKFTNEGGDIYITARSINGSTEGNSKSESFLQIMVKDTGVGITEDKIQFIFDRFYQVDDTTTRSKEGTGIGLALVSELVKIMGGNITVKSKIDTGTEFTILLPIRHITSNENSVGSSYKNNISIPELTTTHAVSQSLENSEIAINVDSNNSKPRILLVEDNPDVVAYIASCLQYNYTIYVGNDGQEGIDIALDSIPDLIISDVMMPHKDGFELCQSLKEDERTSHIPIIILTAKVDIESRLEGLQNGADVYLDKPFNKKELLIRISSLLQGRKRLQQYYLSKAMDSPAPSLPQELIQSGIIEDKFILKIRDILEANFDKYDFTVNKLCKEMNMSKSQLFRKVTALIGMSPSVYIRHVRLSKAKIMLKESNDSIMSISMSVGFEDPGYFSRIFKKEYGVSPNEWRV